MLLLMMGNGLQGTLLSIRGALEGFSPATMSYIMSAYMIGMLLGSRASPLLISNVAVSYTHLTLPTILLV